MESTMQRILKWWHIIFGIVAVFFAAQYLQDGLAEGGSTPDKVKGGIWVALAIFMIVPELFRRRKKGVDDAT